MLRPPIWVLVFIYFMFLSLVIAIWAALDSTATLGALALATLAMPLISKSLTSKISVTEKELRIDAAHIDRKYLGKVTISDSQAMRLLRTRDADPAAYLAIKFWGAKGIKIEITDPRDATPYWLITSKRGEEFAASLIKR